MSAASPQPPNRDSDQRQPARPRDRRTVTILFADVVGSTASTAGSDLEAGYALLRPALEIVVATVDRYGGTLNRLLGDGALATFGAPMMLEDHALRACRCALSIQAALAGSGIPVKMRVGINSGSALITQSTEGQYVTYDSHGPAVNL